MSGKDDPKLSDATRRAVLKGTAGALGVGAMGTASAHEWGDESGPAGENTWTSQRENSRGETEGAKVVGYHALGDADTANPDPEAEAQNPHYGGITEIRTHGDYAYVGFFSSGSETPGRGMAILDISDYNRIPADAPKPEQEAMLENAQISVVSFLRNNTASASVMDVKVSDDGNYVFLSTQPYQQLFGSASGNTQDPTVIEGFDPTPNLEDEGATTQVAGIVAVDVTDKSNPEVLSNFSLEGSGSHNAYHHRIGGDDYIFAINDSGNLAGAGEGMFVLRFDRTTGTLELVNQWEYERNFAQGEAGAQNVQGGAYIHDMEVQDDPRTGTPVVYLAYWGRGMWALDASDPSNLEALGQFEMGSAHFAAPAPTLVDGKRVAVASQEVPANSNHTGRVYLVDCDGLFESDPNFDSVPRENGVVQMGELDMWEWQNEYENPMKANTGTDTTNDDSDIDFGPYDFSLSPHNSDFARHMDRSGKESFWIHQAHYGGGIQFLEVVPGDDDGLVGEDARFQEPVKDADGNELSGAAAPHNTTDWRIVKRGYSRPTYDTPKDSRLEGLNYITPFVWGASESNGITFASDINQGVHAVKADGIPVGGADPVANVSREMDGQVFRSGDTNQVDLTLEFADRDLLVRDRLPEGWSYAGGDGTDVEVGEDTFVQFSGTQSGDDAMRYFADAGGSGGGSFGPMQVSDDGGETWHTLAGSSQSVYTLGGGLTLGAAGGAAGALAHQRDRLGDRVRDLLGDD
ncbi:hypothetical protein [Haloglomus halophilum]|uniref:hypothetical protein n=1 Tax=Haloglomus halophilum TaxID=2962672 RepID=UPI0020CA154B|nr:hypothetical protein [Haloglomus halophilum]